MVLEFKTESGALWRPVQFSMLLDAELNYRISTLAVELNIPKRRVVEEALLKHFGIDYAPMLGGE